MEKSIDQSNSTASKGFTRPMGEAASSAHSAVSSAAESTRPTLEQMSTSAHQATEKIAASASKAAEMLEQQTRKLKESQMWQSCQTHMREKPWSSLGMAVGAGVILALLFKRR